MYYSALESCCKAFCGSDIKSEKTVWVLRPVREETVWNQQRFLPLSKQFLLLCSSRCQRLEICSWNFQLPTSSISSAWHPKLTKNLADREKIKSLWQMHTTQNWTLSSAASFHVLMKCRRETTHYPFHFMALLFSKMYLNINNIN